MLSFIRNRHQFFLRSLLAGFTVLLMLSFGLDSWSGMGPSQSSAVAKVGKKEISRVEYSNQLNRLQSYYRNQLGEDYGKMEKFLNLNRRTIDDMISKTVLEQFYKKLDLAAHKKDMADLLKEKDKSFFGETGPTQESFSAYLKAINMTEQSLERLLLAEIMSSQISDMVQQLNYPTSAELKSVFLRKNTKKVFEYAQVAATNFRQGITPSAEELNAYYEEHKASYRKPKGVKFAYLEINPEDYLDQVDVSQEDIEAEYENRKSDFVEPETFSLTKFTVSKESEKSISELFTGEKQEAATSDQTTVPLSEIAETVLEELRSGSTAADVIKKYSTDKQKITEEKLEAVQNKDLSRKAFEAISDLDSGELSAVVKEGDVISFYRLDARKQEQLKPIETVRETLANDLRQQNAPVYAQAAADEMLLLWKRSEKPLSVFAKEKQMEVKETTQFVNDKEPSAEVPLALIGKAISFAAGDKEIVQSEGTNYLVDLLEERESSIPDLEEVQEQIREELTQKMASDKAKEFAEKAIGVTDQKTSLSDLIASLDSTYRPEIKMTQPMTRDEATSEPFNVPKLKDAAFSLRKPSPVAKQAFNFGDDYFLIALVSEELPPEEDFQKEIKKMRESQAKDDGTKLLSELTESLKLEQEIWVDPNLE